MKVKKINPVNGINVKSHRKENHFQNEFEGQVYHDGKIKTPVTLRIYGTNAKNYACLWIHDSNSSTHCNGSGSAGGYGYHRPSAAAQEAINSAGVELSEPIDGRGDSAIEDAVRAIVRKLYPRCKSINVHKGHA